MPRRARKAPSTPSTKSRAAPAPPPAVALDRRDRWLAALTALLSLGIYLFTLAPTVTAEDAGELVTAAARGGVAHPPGYPLWCLLARAFIAIPGGNPAAHAALMSAVFGALTAGVVYLLARALSASRVAAFAAALCLTLSRSFWAQAVIAEVYTLHAFLLAATLLALVRWSQTRDDRLLLAASALFGLSLANHYQLTGLTAPALLLYVALVDRRVFVRPKTILPAALLVVGALSLYLYLPLAARGDPPINWGDPSTPGRFWVHVSRLSYRKVEMGNTGDFADKVRFFGDFLALFASQATPFVLVPFGALGLHAMRERRRELALLGAVVALDSIALILLLRFPFEEEHRMRMDELYLPAYIATAPIMAAGITWAMARARPFAEARPALARAIPALAAALPIVPLAVHYRDNDLSCFTIARDFNLAALESIEPDAVLFTSGDYSSFPSLYLQAVEGIRPDVILADVTGTLSPAARRYLREIDPSLDGADRAAAQAAFVDKGKRPVYFAAKSDMTRAFPLEAWGYVYRVIKRGALPSVKKPDILRAPAPAGQTGMDDLGASVLADIHLMRGEALVLAGQREKARAEYAEAAKWGAGSKQALNNLGGTCAERGFFDDAEKYLKAALGLSATYATPRRNLAKMYERRGKRAEALALYRDLGTIAPDDEGAKQKAAELAGGASAALSDPRLADLIAAARREPKNAAIYNNLGSVYAEHHDGHRAAAAYEEAIAIDPAYALPHKNLSILYREQLGDPRAAAEHMARYRALVAVEDGGATPR